MSNVSIPTAYIAESIPYNHQALDVFSQSLSIFRGLVWLTAFLEVFFSVDHCDLRWVLTW